MEVCISSIDDIGFSIGLFIGILFMGFLIAIILAILKPEWFLYLTMWKNKK